ncbi:MAG: multicopper oxidase domain-containing protein, partial [Gemmatimonadaceae bacterium]
MIGAFYRRLLVLAIALSPSVAVAQVKPPPKKPAMKGMPGMEADTGKPKPRRPSKEKMGDMPGMHGDHAAMSMPIPMPAGMPMIPGLVGLRPPVAPFLPGAGVNPMTLPPVKPTATIRVKSGDTLDLTAALVRRTIRGHAFAMYAFNGQVPGPLLRVSQGATITVRFHNRIELPSTIHWHGLRHDNRFDGV